MGGREVVVIVAPGSGCAIGVALLYLYDVQKPYNVSIDMSQYRSRKKEAQELACW